MEIRATRPFIVFLSPVTSTVALIIYDHVLCIKYCSIEIKIKKSFNNNNNIISVFFCVILGLASDWHIEDVPT